jgi:hypothetical protein
VLVVGFPVVAVGRGFWLLFWFWLFWFCCVVVVVGLFGAAWLGTDPEPTTRTTPASRLAEINRPSALERIGPPQ